MWYDDFLNAETLVAIGLVIALLICIIFGSDSQLAMSIASGLIGYIGRSKVSSFGNKKEDK